MVQLFLMLRNLVGQFFSFLHSWFSRITSFRFYHRSKLKQTVILEPTHKGFQQELKLRTEAFDKYTMSETMKDLEKAIYHLSASVTQLKEQGKSNEERLINLSTTHEELLHTFEDYLTTPNHEDVEQSTADNDNDKDNEDSEEKEDEAFFKTVWDTNKKGIVGLN